MTAGMLAGACVLDVVVGDPRRLPHPVRFIGQFVAWVERQWIDQWSDRPKDATAVGVVLALGLPAMSALTVWGAIWLADLAHAGHLVETCFAFWALSARDLSDHALKVQHALCHRRIDAARSAVGQIVGRDTALLPEPEIVRATVETVAESSCDGIVAPLFFLAVGGAPLAWFYKTVNTLDSMIGHRELPYRDIGWASARLDDLLNWIPARLTAGLVIAAAGLRFGQRERILRGWRTLIRDGHRHPSPNSGRPEAAMAGVLGIQLGGENQYEGRVERRPTIGTACLPHTPDRITEAVSLMWGVFALAAAWACGVLA